jgi:hypothetical protein
LQGLALLALGAGAVLVVVLANAGGAGITTSGVLARGVSLLALTIFALTLMIIIREARRLPRKPPPRRAGIPRRALPDSLVTARARSSRPRR